jgi:ComF family protein
VLSHGLRRVGEVVFPATCLGCGRRGTALCELCRAALPFLPVDVCQRCAAPTSGRGTCHGCGQLSAAVSSIRAVFAYQGAARAAVVRLKFRSGRYVAPLMGSLVCEALAARPLQADVVVPVPLSRGRMRERGFNQAALLANVVAPSLGGVLLPGLLDRDERPAQRTLKAAERLSNLQGAFRCTLPTTVAGRRVVLIDDVVTTGATLSACADTLAAAGARRVTGLAFARAI